MFLDLIKEKRCRLKDYIDSYQGQPLIVLGAGYGSKGIIQYLNDHAITDFHVCVNDCKWEAGNVAWGSYPVERIGDVLASAKKPYDIIVTFAGFNKRMEAGYRRDYPGKVHHVEFDDVVSHSWMKSCIFTVDRAFYEIHESDLDRLYNDLCDDFSRKVMISFIEQRISGDYSYSEGMVSCPHDKYFEPCIIFKDNHLVLFDCGAYNGEDTRIFFERYGDDLKAFVVEPDEGNMKMAKENLAAFNDRIVFVDKVVANSETTMAFRSGNGESSGLADDGESKVASTTIDSLYKKVRTELEGRDVIIKMDIEGAELKALRGAEQLIREKMPILSICLYHKPEDIIEIPRYIKSLHKDYKFYLRRYESSFRELVLYAVP